MRYNQIMEIALAQNQLFTPVVTGSGSFVDSDQAAVRAFLRQLEASPLATERAYKKEIRRFLAWLHYAGYPVGRDALRSLTVIDLEEYFRFLRSPAPLPKSAEDGGGYWKRDAVLAPSSMRHAKTLLTSFFEKLCDYEITPGEPFRRTNPVAAIGQVVQAPRGKRKPGERAPLKEEEFKKFLFEEDLALIHATIEGMPKDAPEQRAHYHRNRWVFALGLHSWLRLSELSRLQMGDFQLDKSGLWKLYVHPSKHERKAVEIDVPPIIMDELAIYRRSLGKFAHPMRSERGPAICPLAERSSTPQVVRTALLDRNNQPTGAFREEVLPAVAETLTDRLIFGILKLIFKASASAATNPWQRLRLQAASPHWLRHTGITRALNAGIDPRFVAAQARHKDLATTFKTYDHGLDAAGRERELRKMRSVYQ